MSRTSLWILATLLALGALGIWFGYMPTRQTELQRRGKIGYATVQLKDSQPIADGTMVYTITFLYQDEQNRNHQVTVQMLDKGKWDGLKEKQDIKCRYLPEDLNTASIDGGIGMVAPHSSALSFLAWSLLIASIISAIYAYKPSVTDPDAPQQPKKKSKNKVTIARH